MSPYPRYWLYSVGRGPSTDERHGPLQLRLPDLGAPTGLPEEYRYLAKPFSFKPPEKNGRLHRKTLPLTEEQARDLERHGWLVAKLYGNGEPRLPSQVELLAVVTARRDEVLSARSKVYSLLSPFGDYVEANHVRRYLRAGRTEKYRIEELPEAELPFEGGLAKLPAMIEYLEGLRRELRKAGWRFQPNGATWEPPEGGHRRRFPSGLICRAYDSLATQYKHAGRGQGIVPYLQEVLRPQVGDLTEDEIVRALKNHLRK